MLKLSGWLEVPCIVILSAMKMSLAVALAITVAACTGDGATNTTVIEAETTTTGTFNSASTLPPVVECPGEGEFEEGGGIADIDTTGSDSSNIGRISWETSDRCETFHFDFETSEGAPATTVPDIGIDHLDSFQVVRVGIDVDASVITGQLVETGLVERLYVVRSLDGGMFVDLHLSQPAAVRATTLSSPARLSIDLRPGFVPFVGESEIDDQVVLVSPTTDTEVGTPTQLSGYARTFEGTVVVLASQGDSIVTEAETVAADYLETWGEFRVQLRLPAGAVSVFLGGRSPEDGSLDGLNVEIIAN
jgi:hypothetical protein